MDTFATSSAAIASKPQQQPPTIFPHEIFPDIFQTSAVMFLDHSKPMFPNDGAGPANLTTETVTDSGSSSFLSSSSSTSTSPSTSTSTSTSTSSTSTSTSTSSFLSSSSTMEPSPFAFAFADLGGGLDAPRSPPTLTELEKIMFGSAERERIVFVNSNNNRNTDNGGSSKKDQDEMECVVCYEPFDSDIDWNHPYFKQAMGGRCNHGTELCGSCADKVPQCPVCRDIKPGMELALELREENNDCSCSEAYEVEQQQHEQEHEQHQHELSQSTINDNSTHTTTEQLLSADTREVFGAPLMDTEDDMLDLNLTIATGNPTTEIQQQHHSASPLLTPPVDDDDMKFEFDIEDMINELSNTTSPTLSLPPLSDSTPFSPPQLNQQPQQEKPKLAQQHSPSPFDALFAYTTPPVTSTTPTIPTPPESDIDILEATNSVLSSFASTQRQQQHQQQRNSAHSQRKRGKRKSKPTSSASASASSSVLTSIIVPKQQQRKSFKTTARKVTKTPLINIPAAITAPIFPSLPSRSPPQSSTSTKTKTPTKTPADATPKVLKARTQAVKKESKQSRVVRARKRTDLDNPFKSIALSDDEVCDIPFPDLVKAMKEHGFTDEMMERGKRHRKRLKNRRQVMSYANRKKDSTDQTKHENSSLEQTIFTLNKHNSTLEQTNKKLDLLVRSKRNESQSLTSANDLLLQQIEALNKQLHSLI